MYSHKPVMIEEVLRVVRRVKPNLLADLTLGQAGHLTTLLKDREASSSLEMVFTSDMDASSLEFLRTRLYESFEVLEETHTPLYHVFKVRLGNRRTVEVTFRQGRLSEAVKLMDFLRTSVILLDLGISTYQIEHRDGISFSRNTPLDMRLDPNSPITAAEILMNYPEEELARLFRELGGCKFSRQVARRISLVRRNKRIDTTGELVKIVEKSVPARFSLRTLRQVFQALRIEVNRELEDLEGFVEGMGRVQVEGTLTIIALTYHSLERRVLKGLREKGFKLSVKLKPNELEVSANPSARSAILYVYESSS